MAKITKTEEEVRQQNVAEAVSKTELFFKQYGKFIYSCVFAVLAIALIVLLYNHLYLQPKKVQATDEMIKAEQWFSAGEYELALNGDGNSLGFADILNQYGSKAGEAIYLYTGICQLQTGAFEEALASLKKYNGEDPILLSRAQACTGDAYVELEQYDKAIACYEKAAATVDNALAAAYLLKAGIAAESNGDNAKALSFYKTIKDQWGNAPEAMEIDKYITRIETAE